jgi:hypothetical protein
MSDIGREFERDFATALGARLTPGSGNKWFAQMDVDSGQILWSLKATQLKAFPLSRALIDEVVAATEGPGGTGSVPGMAIRIGSPEYDLVVLRKDDFIRLFEEHAKLMMESKASARRERANIPILLREDGNANSEKS